jgi:hypothetical protein
MQAYELKRRPNAAAIGYDGTLTVKPKTVIIDPDEMPEDGDLCAYEFEPGRFALLCRTERRDQTMERRGKVVALLDF